MHTLQTILLVAPMLLFSVIAHEIAHGYAALLQGDRTALDAGRLSWNPARHIDPFLTIILPLMMIVGSLAAGVRGPVLGGARPVPVNAANYRHLKRGDILVSLAGVATNLLIFLLCAALIPALGFIGSSVPVAEETLAIIQAMLATGMWLNAALIAFNLLPIPPLDGSHVFKYLLPRPLAERYVRFGRFGFLALILLLSFGDRLLALWVSPAMMAHQQLFGAVSGYLLPSAGQWLR